MRSCWRCWAPSGGRAAHPAVALPRKLLSLACSIALNIQRSQTSCDLVRRLRPCRIHETLDPGDTISNCVTSCFLLSSTSCRSQASRVSPDSHFDIYKIENTAMYVCALLRCMSITGSISTYSARCLGLAWVPDVHSRLFSTTAS